ncbi:FG-GAP repeat domain-containing protein [Actinoplanes sp. NPDC049265]|uniref:FG-GAP repeat domain-containing protein n=1 Tax=Actinoplanes sp. NPDC049265 TaxID=3363902 RepID=UPI0037124010
MTCRWWGATGVVAAAVVAGLFFAPGVALADPQTRIPSAPCQPDGVAPADTEIAGRLRPLMTGVRLGSSLTGYSVSCARAIVSNVQNRGMEQRAAVIAVATAITESTLHNYTTAVDKDSLGLFQQRPSQGWGRPGQLVDPRFATNAFLSSMVSKHPGGTWRVGDIGQICQRVQRSAYPGAYTPEVHDAQLLVTTLWPHVAAALATGKGTATGTPSRKAARGPFQHSLFTSATSQGPADARHDFLLADWNGDQRPDLFVVQRSGTVTGGTTVSIFDGRSTLPTAAMNFQRPLLRTGTVLGATDDRYAFAVADWNADGRPDLIVTQRSGTASGRTEVNVIDGASSFQRYLLQTATVLAATDKRYDFAVGDWNTDGRLDLVVVERSARTNVRIIDGSSNFQHFLLETPTALGAADDTYAFSVADWNTDGRLDLVAVHRSRKTELRVLSGATTFQRYLLQSGTALGATDDKYAFATTDWNDDGRPDLLAVRKSGAPSGRAEAHVLAG